MPAPLIVKICGIRTETALNAAVEAGADMVGFVHFPRSPRHLELDPIAELISSTRGRAESCVLLVNPDNTLVAQVAALGPDWIQLHGPETPHRVEAVREGAGIAVMKACCIASAKDVAAVNQFAQCADRILLDAKPPAGATRPGGLGTAFDWTLLKALDPAVGFMLSGGLTADNVAEALAVTHPLGVDVSSGVERAPGIKDAALIQKFVAAARGAARP